MAIGVTPATAGIGAATGCFATHAAQLGAAVEPQVPVAQVLAAQLPQAACAGVAATALGDAFPLPHVVHVPVAQALHAEFTAPFSERVAMRIEGYFPPSPWAIDSLLQQLEVVREARLS